MERKTHLLFFYQPNVPPEQHNGQQ